MKRQCTKPCSPYGVGRRTGFWPFSFIRAYIFSSLCVLFSSGGLQPLYAQDEASLSVGCAAANAGDFNLASTAGSSLVSSPFSSTFAAGETLTFTLAAGGGGVARGFAEDATAAVKILDAIMETSASYTIPAGGARSFNLELDADDFDASISVSCTPSPQTGSITISKNSGGIDGDFNFTGDLGAFSVSVAGEPSPQTFSALAAGVYTVIETPQEGFALTSVACVGDDDNGSVIDVEAGSVAIDLDPGEDIVCTFANAQSSLPPGVTSEEVEELSSHAVRNFLYRRASAILSSQPGRSRLIRKSSDVSGVNIEAENGRVEAAFSASAPIAESRFDIWVEGAYSSYEFDGGAEFEGDLGVVYVGADYLLSEGLLIGVLGQFDWASESASSLGEEIDGSGWMAGPYVSARIRENLFFDARAAWGRSSNDLTIEGVVADDEFETTRWLASAALTGNRRFGKWRFAPSVSVVYFEEEQEAYVSRTEVEIPSQTVALGRATMEPAIAYRHVMPSGVVIEPQASVAGLWDFETPGNLSIPGWEIVTDEFRVRAGGGVRVAWPGGFALRANGFYEGLGAENLEGYGVRLRIDAPLGFGGKRRQSAPVQPAPRYKTCADGTRVLLSDDCPQFVPRPPIEALIGFADAKANLSPEAYDALSSLWRGASGEDIARIRVEASGDAGAANRDALAQEALAVRRAEAVKAALVGLGAPAGLIETETVSGSQSSGGLVVIEFE